MYLCLFYRIFEVLYISAHIGVYSYSLIQFVRHRRVVLSQCMSVLMIAGIPYCLLGEALHDPDAWGPYVAWAHYMNAAALVVSVYKFVIAFRTDREREEAYHTTHRMLELASPDAEQGELRRRARELMKLYDENYEEYVIQMRELDNEIDNRIAALEREVNRLNLLNRLYEHIIAELRRIDPPAAAA